MQKKSSSFPFRLHSHYFVVGLIIKKYPYNILKKDTLWCNMFTCYVQPKLKNESSQIIMDLTF